MIERWGRPWRDDKWSDFGPVRFLHPRQVGEGWVYHLSGQLASANQSYIALGAWWSGVVEWTEDTVRVRSGMLWGDLAGKATGLGASGTDWLLSLLLLYIPKR